MRGRSLIHCLCSVALAGALVSNAAGQIGLPSRLTLHDAAIVDQDDMCFWLHPSDFSQSTVICSDKSADKLFVYDLAGHTLQTLTAQQPGNIDIRYGFPFAGQHVDLVALNERSTQKIRVYRVDPVTRQLVAVDNGNIVTGSNYGFTLYRSRTTGKLYGFTGPSSNTIVRQYELYDDGAGHIAGSAALRSVQPGGTVEGMVADDETGKLYLSEEPGGVWKYGAEPGDPVTGTRIATVGENGLTSDVEGITIYYRALGAGYLVVSSQGNSQFKVYDRQPPHTFRGTFTVSGVGSTDGVDVINVALSPDFPRGAFACHNGTAQPYPVELLRWEDIATPLALGIDTAYWDPRIPATSSDVGEILPASVRFQASPNPTSGGTRIHFALPAAHHVRLAVFDARGRRVRRLLDEVAGAGWRTVIWAGDDDAGREAGPGLYFARLDLDGVPTEPRKIAVLR